MIYITSFVSTLQEKLNPLDSTSIPNCPRREREARTFCRSTKVTHTIVSTSAPDKPATTVVARSRKVRARFSGRRRKPTLQESVLNSGREPASGKRWVEISAETRVGEASIGSRRKFTPPEVGGVDGGLHLPRFQVLRHFLGVFFSPKSLLNYDFVNERY